MTQNVPLYGFGSGGTGATLTVNAPAGVTVTVSKDGKSKTKVADTDGVAVFKGLSTGEWTLTITNGTDTSTDTVQLTADYSTSTANWWKDIHYFTRAEFRCPCGKCGGFPVEPEEKMVRTVDAIRAKLGKPITISSGVRCQAHNDELPGSAKDSNHLKGLAADLHCNTVTPAEMKAAAEAVMGKTGGIGLYQWGIHVDVGKYSRWNG